MSTNTIINGIVLKATPYKEHDMLLTLLTAEHGKMNVLARGARRAKRTNLHTQPFSYSAFNVFRGKGVPICDGADLIEAFYDLRSDIEKLATGQYFLEVTDTLPEAAEESTQLLKLLLNSLHLLANDKKDTKNKEKIIKIVFELKFSLLSGFSPDFGEECAACGEKPSVWSFDDGFLCEPCAIKTHGIKYNMASSMINAVSHILMKDGIYAYSFKMDDESLQKLGQITEKYIQHKLETKFKSLDFFNI